mmetsp:Transcript_40350/g.72452  ORF Transcript_40350/g.72452 Transcript_40350/m.72452 type:complete len:243 (-) Transcript_40350:109-837(-)
MIVLRRERHACMPLCTHVPISAFHSPVLHFPCDSSLMTVEKNWLSSFHECALQCLLQIAVLILLNHNVTSAVELASNIDLREGGPRGVLLEPPAQRVVLQDVDTLEGRLQVVQNLDHGVGEAALWELRRPLHEHHHLVLPHVLIQRSTQLRRQPGPWAHGGDLRRLGGALVARGAPTQPGGKARTHGEGGRGGMKAGLRGCLTCCGRHRGSGVHRRDSGESHRAASAVPVQKGGVGYAVRDG